MFRLLTLPFRLFFKAVALAFKLFAKVLTAPLKLVSALRWLKEWATFALVAGAAAVGIAWGLAALAKRGEQVEKRKEDLFPHPVR